MAQLDWLGTPPPTARPASGSRDALDRYYTPPRLARAIVTAVHAVEPLSGVVLEPSAGAGAFARAILDLTPAEVIVADLDPAAPALMSPAWAQRRAAGERTPCASYCGRDFASIDWLRPAWVIGNPPYSAAEEHVRHALTMSRHVVFLLRAAFVESKGRSAFWRDHPCRHVWFCAERPSFTSGGTDSAAYAVFWWDTAYHGPTTCTPGWTWRA